MQELLTETDSTSITFRDLPNHVGFRFSEQYLEGINLYQVYVKVSSVPNLAVCISNLTDSVLVPIDQVENVFVHKIGFLPNKASSPSLQMGSTNMIIGSVKGGVVIGDLFTGG